MVQGYVQDSHTQVVLFSIKDKGDMEGTKKSLGSDCSC